MRHGPIQFDVQDAYTNVEGESINGKTIHVVCDFTVVCDIYFATLFVP